MEIGTTTRTGREARGLSALARREERVLGQRAPADRAAGGQAVLGIAVAIRVHRLASDAQIPEYVGGGHALDVQETLLQRDLVAGVANQGGIRADDAVAGNHDG